ncbi:MAG: PDZ domain-containing protein [Candidatus Nealsonbacteria bacterium]|nr:PDZ domain-containing protein [Candidatus Nealsonbacteria bacterium]
MSRNVWISSIAAMLLCTPWAAGQDDRKQSEHQVGPIRVVVEATAEPQKKVETKRKVSVGPVRVQLQATAEPDKKAETPRKIFVGPVRVQLQATGKPGKPIKVKAAPLHAAGKPANVVVTASLKLSDYWVGLACRPASDALRAQLRLPKGEGLVVDHVVEKGPAAKAGVQQHDVLLKAGKTPLKELADLVAAVEKAKESEVALELIRVGKKKTIKLTPAKRPEDAAARQPLNVSPEGIHLELIRQWIPEIKPGKMNGPFEFRIIRPGALLPPTAKVHPPMPGNLSVAITKQGDNPKKIVVTRGDQKWEVTEKNLKELPDDVRPHVERMLGRIKIMAPLEKIRTFNVIPKVIGSDGAIPKIQQRLLPHALVPEKLHREHQKQIDKQLGEMSRQIEELRKSLDQLRKSEAPAEQPEEE